MARARRSRWIVAGFVVAAAAVLGPLVLLAIGLDTEPAGFLAGFLMASVPVPFYIALSLWLDRFEPEPWWLLAIAFLWGASIAVFFAMIFNGINEGVLVAVAGAANASTLTAVLSAPFVEELAKGAALLLLFVWRRDEFDGVTDGIVYATMAGLGFAMTENVQYYSQAFTADGGGSAAAVFFLRGIMGPFSHPLFTSMTGIGLGLARESDRTWVRWLAPPLGLAGAMFLHGVWNLSASFGLAFFAAYFFFMVPVFAGVGVIMMYSLRREANVIRSHLEAVVAEGVLSRDDVIVVTSARRRVGESTRALFAGGFGKWIARRRFHALATELAFHSWRTSRETYEDAQAIHAELLDAVRAARERLGLPPAASRPPEPELVARLTREIPLPILPADAREQRALVCTAGPLAGMSFSIGYTGLQIGRDPASAEVVVSDRRVSKRHAWVGYGSDGLVVLDRGSSNGTRVNGVPVREAVVAPGDSIELAEGAASFQVF